MASLLRTESPPLRLGIFYPSLSLSFHAPLRDLTPRLFRKPRTALVEWRHDLEHSTGWPARSNKHLNNLSEFEVGRECVRGKISGGFRERDTNAMSNICAQFFSFNVFEVFQAYRGYRYFFKPWDHVYLLLPLHLSVFRGTSRMFLFFFNLILSVKKIEARRY